MSQVSGLFTRYVFSSRYSYILKGSRRWNIRYLSCTRELPDKTPFQLEKFNFNSTLQFHQNAPKIISNYINECDAITQRRKSSNTFSEHNDNAFRWINEPHNFLIVKKPDDKKTDDALMQISKFVQSEFPNFNIILEPEVAHIFKDSLPFAYVPPKDDASAEYIRTIDGVIALGGDGTMLHVSSLFDHSAVPPVLSFSMGTVGFLLPFHILDYKQAITDFVCSRLSLKLRMRLECSLHYKEDKMINNEPYSEKDSRHLMNEVNLHRGSAPHLTVIDTFINGQHLTEAVADGLIIATPTGSTAYSLSAGGPIVHPSVQSLILTPICPRSLSFRPVLLPSDSIIQLKISERSRSPASISMDGRDAGVLNIGDYIQVAISPYPIPCVNRPEDEYQDQWSRDINNLLKWNASFGNKRLLH